MLKFNVLIILKLGFFCKTLAFLCISKINIFIRRRCWSVHHNTSRQLCWPMVLVNPSTTASCRKTYCSWNWYMYRHNYQFMKLKILLRQYNSESMVTVNVVADIEMLEKWHKIIDRLINFYAGFMYVLWIFR